MLSEKGHNRSLRMRTTTGRKSYFLLAFIGLAVICFGLHTVQAQSKAAKAKPPKPPPVTYLPLAVDQEHPPYRDVAA